MTAAAHCDTAVIGGGFFGCMLASELAGSGQRVILLEREADLLQRASYRNQARVHHGYHYPRSVLTALRSRFNFPRFVQDFSDCVVSDFTKLYAVARHRSKVSARQFRTFMEQIGAPIAPVPSRYRRLFAADLIEEVFQVVEFAFDAVKLKEASRRRLEESSAEYRLNTNVLRLASSPDGIRVIAEEQGEQLEIVAKQVFNCTYSRINTLLAASGLPLIPLKHELAEMALVEPPEEFAKAGVTVMCGPFFSLVPFPAQGLHTLTHVRYSPHFSWEENDRDYPKDVFAIAERERSSHFPHMMRDASRYLPCLRRCRHRSSLWEIKTVLPQSEQDDSRPILFRRDFGLRNLTCVMGAKIDNIYDAISELQLSAPVNA
jgi:glycine/D-amino acid oxidase-like deaminating enzyme